MKTSDDEIKIRRIGNHLLDTAVLTERAIRFFSEELSNENRDMSGLAAATILALQTTHRTISSASRDIAEVVGE